jgi:6-phosphofructokinase 1
MSQKCIQNLKKNDVDCLIVIGGDGTLTSGRDFSRMGFPVIGVPKTIDNDVPSTDITFGSYTAVEIPTEAIDRIKTTAESHGRILVLEVMGRYAGWIALAAGIAGGADTVLIPEIPYDFNNIINKIEQRRAKGKKHSIIVVAEGAKPIGGDVAIREIEEKNAGLDQVKLGGAGEFVAREIEKLTGYEARSTSLGYIQRGGNTGAYDRILSTQYGSKAMQLALEGKFNEMVTLLNVTVEDHDDKIKEHGIAINSFTSSITSLDALTK